jgi:DNA-binding LacI/PurR family transcriptional regulator
VGIDDHQAAYDATEHLIRLGCSELLMINSERDWTTHVLREKGFEEAAINWAGDLPRRVIRLPNCETPVLLGQRLRQELSDIQGSFHRPLGVVAWWDEMALQTMEFLCEAGWNVPTDVRIIGFANDLGGELAEVPLTTVAIPREEIARLAATALVSQINHPSRPVQRIRLKARLILRESCGAYPRRMARSSVPVGELGSKQ